MKRIIVFTLALFSAVSAPVFAQGVQTGTIRGMVKDQQGLAVPGVTVTATSPALQGARTAVTDAEGNYTLTALPPGAYTVTFELSGFGDVKRTVTLPLGLTVEQNVTMRPAGVTETVQVVADPPAPIATPIVGINLKHEEIEALATPRTIQGIATLVARRSPRTSPNVAARWSSTARSRSTTSSWSTASTSTTTCSPSRRTCSSRTRSRRRRC